MTHRMRFVAVTATVLALAAPRASAAADITVLCSTPLRHVMTALIPEFERATKHRVLITYGASPELTEKIEAGAPFDLVVLTPGFMDGLIERGKVAAATRTPIARVGVAIAIKAGARKPDISTTAALKKTLVEARSISFGTEGASRGRRSGTWRRARHRNPSGRRRRSPWNLSARDSGLRGPDRRHRDRREERGRSPGAPGIRHGPRSGCRGEADGDGAELRGGIPVEFSAQKL